MRTTRSSRPNSWSIVPTQKVLQARDHNQRHIVFLRAAPNAAASFEISVLVDRILDARRPAGQAPQGGYANKAHRDLAGECQVIAEQVCASLRSQDREAEVRIALAAAGIPAAALGSASDLLFLLTLRLAVQTDSQTPLTSTPWSRSSIVNRPDSTLTQELDVRSDNACAQAEEADARGYDTWVNTINNIVDPYKLSMAKILLVAVVDAFNEEADNVATLPSDLQVRAKFQELLHRGYGGHSDIDWFCRFRRFQPEDPGDDRLAAPNGKYVRCDFVRCDITRGNKETSVIVSLRAYEEDGGQEGDFDDAVDGFIDDTLDLVRAWSASGDDQSLGSAVEAINQVKLAPKPRLGGRISKPPLCPPAEWAIRRTLLSNISCARLTYADVSTLNRDEAVSVLFKRCVMLIDGLHVVRSEYTNAVIKKFDPTPMNVRQYQSYLQEHQDGHSNVSLDHEFQCTIRTVHYDDDSNEYSPAFFVHADILDAMDQPDDHEAVLTGSEANFREAISKLLGTAETMGRQADDGINAADTALDPLDDPLTTAYIQQLFDNGLVSQQRLDDSFTSVRSAEDGNYAVSKKALHEAEKAILKTGKNSINLEHYGVAFILIAEGVPSLNLLGTESAFEIAAALRGMSHTTSIPSQYCPPSTWFTSLLLILMSRKAIEELYAHLICSKVHAVLGDKLGSSICYTEDIPPINFIIYMASCPSQRFIPSSSAVTRDEDST
ncbi:hypothetical protein JCM11641_007534 [Rhodosporidiobolus odoratus]